MTSNAPGSPRTDHTDAVPVDSRENRRPLNEKTPAASGRHLDRHVRELIRIGIALSTEKDINKLLDMIVVEARTFVNADAGTLYILDKDKQSLRFEILQNDSIETHIGGRNRESIRLPQVPLYDADGKPNHGNVSSYVALTGKIVNIPDVYQAVGFDFTGPKQYDATTGYRSTSMLVLPLKNHENDIIGVLQLLNAQDPVSGRVVPFPGETVDLIASLASQAAIALTNTQLIQDLTDLFYAFIKSIATAIDEKSAYTGGHIKRVVDISRMLAEAIDRSTTGPFRRTRFSAEEMEVLRLAAWMHDVGKITTPEYVVDKSTKLETRFDRLALIETRFSAIAQALKTDCAARKIELLKKGAAEPAAIEALDAQLAHALAQLNADLDRIRRANDPAERMDDEAVAGIRAIGHKSYTIDGAVQPYLSRDEIENLCVRKGTLTSEERAVVENHAAVTLKILDALPFPRKYRRVPKIASGHHEKLDGSGYPQQLKGRDLPLETRILAIADIFEALSARDRPYKRPMKLSQIVTILQYMVKDGHIDSDIVALFINSGCLKSYADKHMAPEQNDLNTV